MTSILTIAQPMFVVQVSDRLLTRSDNQSAHDTIANKTIVLHAQNGIAAISYAGIAYIKKIQTDEWIAQCITGVSAREPDGRSSMSLGGNRNSQTIEQILYRLKKALARRSEPRRYGLDIIVSGWKIGKPRPLPFIAVINCPKYGKPELRYLTPKKNRWRKRIYVAYVGVPPWTELNAEIATHRTTHSPMTPIEQAEQILIRTISNIADKNKTVGRDMISVSLPYIGECKSRFIPSENHIADIDFPGNTVIPIRGVDKASTVAHTPWVITRGKIYPPSELIGAISFDFDGMKFWLEGAQSSNDKYNVFYTRGLKRKPPL